MEVRIRSTSLSILLMVLRTGHCTPAGLAGAAGRFLVISFFISELSFSQLRGHCTPANQGALSDAAAGGKAEAPAGRSSPWETSASGIEMPSWRASLPTTNASGGVTSDSSVPSLRHAPHRPASQLQTPISVDSKHCKKRFNL